MHANADRKKESVLNMRGLLFKVNKPPLLAPAFLLGPNGRVLGDEPFCWDPAGQCDSHFEKPDINMTKNMIAAVL